MRLASVIINTHNPRELSEFWSQVLEVEISMAIPGDYFIWLKPQQEGGVGLGFQKVDDDPMPPGGRMHVDLVVEDRAAAIAKVVDLGGTVVAEHNFDTFVWTVVADPEGNQFCLAEHPDEPAN